MSAQSRPARPPGAVVSERGNQLAPLPSAFTIEPASGDKYTPQDVLSLVRPVQPLPISGQPMPQSILTGNPLAPENLHQGDRLTVVNYRWLMHHGGSSSGSRSSRKPKHQIRNNKSAFIARGVVFDSFTKRVKPDDPLECLVFTNFDRSLALIDYSTEGSSIEPLAKVFFAKAWPLCHSLNRYTASTQQLDMVVGMSSGDLVWIELISQRYERINKVGNLTRAPVTAVSWVPNSESLVLAAHADGLLVVYDVYGEDSSEVKTGGPQANPARDSAPWFVLISFNSTTSTKKRSEAVRAAYKLSNTHQRIIAVQFLTPTKFVVAAHDDYLKLFDLETERVTELWPSLFGSILSLALSPDAKYLCCGGEDGLISVFDLQSSELIVRLSGHKAWVRSIAFDPFAFDESSYRLATVGEDRQVIVWDLTPTTLTRPKWHPIVEIENGLKYTSSTHHFSDSNLVVRGRVLQYASSKLFSAAFARPHFEEYGDSPLSDVKFTSKLLLVASSDGRVWCWQKHGTQAAIRRSLDHA